MKKELTKYEQLEQIIADCKANRKRLQQIIEPPLGWASKIDFLTNASQDESDDYLAPEGK